MVASRLNDVGMDDRRLNGVWQLLWRLVWRLVWLSEFVLVKSWHDLIGYSVDCQIRLSS